MDTLTRCWPTNNPLYIEYHDREWGIPVHQDRKLFEFLVLDSFQAGLTWLLILQRREIFKKAFDGFVPAKVARYESHDADRIINTPGIIKNKAKIESTINNACQFLKIQEEFGSFDKFIWQFVNGKTLNNSFGNLPELPSKTKESEAMSKELKIRGFKFVGPTICYAFMQAAGLVNDHLTSCFRYNEIKKLQQS